MAEFRFHPTDVVMKFDLFDQEDDEILLEHRRWSLYKTAIASSTERREHVPNVSNYLADTIRMMTLPDNVDDFRTHFRVSRQLFDVILEEIYGGLVRKDRGQHQTVTPEKQLLVFLWYISNMSSMREVKHIFNLSKSTVHAIVEDVSSAIMELSNQVIRWPAPRKQLEIAHRVQQECTLPGVVGFIDGTHIRLSAALKGDRDYYNRKGYPSIQLQAVVDDTMLITNAYCGWPGCVHDARVLRNSSFYEQAENGELVIQGHHIFADNAYPLRNWLITPFKNFGNLTPQHIRFNKKLSSVRQTVERSFGHLKGRFRRLKEVPFHRHEDICKLIYAACILHNLCIIHEDDVEEYIQADEDGDANDYGNVYQNGHQGVARRLRLLNLA